jgi:hypothetical protein
MRWMATLLGVAAATSGCFAIANLGKYELGEEALASEGGTDGGDEDATIEAQPPGGVDDPTLPSGLRFTMRDMGIHLNQLIEFHLVDNQNTMQMRGIILPLDKIGTQSITLNVPNGIPLENRPYRLDFFADMNSSGNYDGIGNVLTQDHAWRIAPLVDFPAGKFPHVSNLVQVVFEHTKIFVDINQWPMGTMAPANATGLGFKVRFFGAKMAQYKGKLLEVRVSDSRLSRTVGLYRNPQIPDGDFNVFVLGMLEPEVSYNVDVYVDANGNGKYDNPSTQAQDVDLGWRIPTKATLPDAGAKDAGVDAGDAGIDAGGPPIGISIDFDPVGAYPSNTDVGEP